MYALAPVFPPDDGAADGVAAAELHAETASTAIAAIPSNRFI
jgi:hypothetical protein